MRHRRLGWSWVGMTGALALHVVDEAANDFLALYNPLAEVARARLGVPFPPVFQLDVWLGGLAVGILILVGVSWLAFQGARIAVWLALPVGVLMFANGAAHLAFSGVAGRAIAGVWTAPLLLITSAVLLGMALRTVREAP